jgi:hypothetical protein
MKTATAPRTFNVYVMTARGLVDCGTEHATDGADAVRRAFNLNRRPSMRHDGPHGSGYFVRGRWITATPETPAAPARCRLCGEAHEVTAADRIGERGERLSDAEAMLTAHFRLAIARTSAGAFNLFGGRAA